tara:strand:- start:88 stop:282 length:195 start_codon:yes stop_codon:yes gene_type:complete
MIKENLEWLKKQPDTLENRHIQNIVKRSAEHEYGNPCEHNWVCADNEIITGDVICVKCLSMKAA